MEQLDRIKKAFDNSVAGLVDAYKTQRSFREDLVIVIIFLPLALLAQVTNGERALLILSLFLIIICELINTAIETIVDRISTERHPLSKRAKDIGSSVVLLALANAMVVWGFIFF